MPDLQTSKEDHRFSKILVAVFTYHENDAAQGGRKLDWQTNWDLRFLILTDSLVMPGYFAECYFWRQVKSE